MGGNKSLVKNILYNDFASIPIIKAAYIDSDEDGVADPLDWCPDTPQGTLVDINGCPIFTLPASNYKVEVIAATCAGTSNGAIKLTIENINYAYNLIVKGPNKFEKSLTIPKGTKTSSVSGLTLGDYSVVATVDGQKNYQQAFDLKITEPPALSVQSAINIGNQTIDLTLSGATQFRVQVNEASYRVNGPLWTGSLPTGAVKIKVSTDLSCQGMHVEEFFFSEEVKVYPNPTSGPFHILVHGLDTQVQVAVYDLKGASIQTGRFQVDGAREVALDISQVPVGTYLVHVLGTTVDQRIKIAKI
jgi:hypothetical protein